MWENKGKNEWLLGSQLKHRPSKLGGCKPRTQFHRAWQTEDIPVTVLETKSKLSVVLWSVSVRIKSSYCCVVPGHCIQVHLCWHSKKEAEACLPEKARYPRKLGASVSTSWTKQRTWPLKKKMLPWPNGDCCKPLWLIICITLDT